MSRKHIAVLLLQAVLTCSACGHEAKKSDFRSRESAFQRKRVCADLGRERLALDSREEDEVIHSVRAEWCYSTALNTCIYSNTHDVLTTPRDPNETARVLLSLKTTVDLLTNRTLISVDRARAGQGELEEYEKRRRELFSKCQI
jgi:hypothetical protein